MDGIIGQTTIIMIVVSVIKTEKVDLKFYFRIIRQFCMSGGLDSMSRWIFTLCVTLGWFHYDFWSLGFLLVI